MATEIDTLCAIKGKPYKGRIENWSTTDWWGSGKTVVVGDLHDKPGRDPGIVTDIRTSEVYAMHEEYSIVETQNSYYKLGVKHIPYRG
jgi:hypothetical protein